MDIDWNAELIDQLEWHWQHQLRPRLHGLADDEYFWQPVPGCWTLSRRDGSAPDSVGVNEFTMDSAPLPDGGREPVTTIAWRLAHLIDVFGAPNTPHFDVPPTDAAPTDVPPIAYSGTAEQALRRLDAGHDAWIRDIRGLGAAGLCRAQGALSPPAYADAPMARLILYTHLEVIHHGAEVCLLRDLYLWRDGRPA